MSQIPEVRASHDNESKCSNECTCEDAHKLKENDGKAFDSPIHRWEDSKTLPHTHHTIMQTQ